MRASVSKQLLEVDDFIGQFRALPIVGSEERKDYASAYKHFHSLLIWQSYVDNGDDNPLTKMFLNESTADISQSMLCALLNFYKPSRVMIRTAIENIMRVVNSIEGNDPLQFKSVYKLGEAFRQVTSHKPASSAAERLMQSYGSLCDYVHSSTPMHMDLRIPFKQITETIDNEKKACLSELETFCREASKLLFIHAHGHLQKMHHSDADWLKDRLPASLKQKVNVSSF